MRKSLSIDGFASMADSPPPLHVPASVDGSLRECSCLYFSQLPAHIPRPPKTRRKIKTKHKVNIKPQSREDKNGPNGMRIGPRITSIWFPLHPCRSGKCCLETPA